MVSNITLLQRIRAVSETRMRKLHDFRTRRCCCCCCCWWWWCWCWCWRIIVRLSFIIHCRENPRTLFHAVVVWLRSLEAESSCALSWFRLITAITCIIIIIIITIIIIIYRAPFRVKITDSGALKRLAHVKNNVRIMFSAC